jgi:penicillin amidase
MTRDPSGQPLELLRERKLGEPWAARIPGLREPLQVDYDSRGIPSIQAGNREDAACGLGYETARRRLFQMDLLRRRAAGRTAELFGPDALDHDRAQRTLGMAAAAPAILEALPESQRRLLQAYADGVNTWIGSAPPPFELELLQAPPEPWSCEDSILVAQHMMQLLGETGASIRMVETMRTCLPPAVADFLLDGADPYATEAGGEAGWRELPDLPEELPELVAEGRAAPPVERALVAEELPAGSNAWAVAGSRSGDGRALLANDMHLELAAPNIWFRARLEFGGHRVDGVAVPGVPAIAAGSNGRVAWGATRLAAAAVDLIELETDERGERYRTEAGWQPFERQRQEIAVRGVDPVPHERTLTRWGPVWGRPLGGRLLALRWTALEPRGVDFRLFDLCEAGGLEAACDVVNDSGSPPLTVLLADASGRIGWTVAGRFPKRRGAGDAFVRPARGESSWDEYLAPGELPRIVDPPSGTLVSANNLVREHREAGLAFNGFGGRRAARIAELLERCELLDEGAMLRLQHDLDAGFYAFYRDLILDVTASGPDDPEVLVARAALAAWPGTAAAEASGLPILVVFRELVRESVFSTLLSRCVKADPHFHYCWHGHETPLRALLAARRDDLVPAPFESYERFVVAQLLMALTLLRGLRREGGGAPPRWGEVNRTGIRHPLSALFPKLSPLLDRPDLPLGGADECICIARPGFGASLRLSVSPGREREGILNVPGGQAGNPLEATYGDEFSAWFEGRPSPLQPGEPVAQVRHLPAGGGER